MLKVNPFHEKFAKLAGFLVLSHRLLWSQLSLSGQCGPPSYVFCTTDLSIIVGNFQIFIHFGRRQRHFLKKPSPEVCTTMRWLYFWVRMNHFPPFVDFFLDTPSLPMWDAINVGYKWKFESQSGIQSWAALFWSAVDDKEKCCAQELQHQNCIAAHCRTLPHTAAQIKKSCCSMRIPPQIKTASPKASLSWHTAMMHLAHCATMLCSTNCNFPHRTPHTAMKHRSTLHCTLIKGVLKKSAEAQKWRTAMPCPLQNCKTAKLHLTASYETAKLLSWCI